MNTAETSWPINIKFHLEHYWGEELAKLGFGLNQIRTLVSMATDSSFIFDRFFFMLAANEYNHKISNWFEIWHDTTRN